MSLKSFKDIFATLPGSVNNRRHYGMGLCSCIRAKTAAHFSMYHGIAQRSLRSVIIIRNTRNMQKYQKAIPVLPITLPQSLSVNSTHFPLKQMVKRCFYFLNFPLEYLRRQASTMLNQTLGMKKQSLHPICPMGTLTVHCILQISQLMSMAKLMMLPRSLALGTPQVAYPNYRLRFSHHFFYYYCPSAGSYHVIGGFFCDEHPLPLILAINSGARLIRTYYLTMPYLIKYLFCNWTELFACPFNQVHQSTNRYGKPKQNPKNCLKANITHVMYLMKICHKRCQPASKYSLRFHSIRVISGLLSVTIRTCASISLCLNYHGLNRGYLNNLTAPNHLLLYILQVGAAVRTSIKSAFYENIWFYLNTTLAHMAMLCAALLSSGTSAVTFSFGRRRNRRIRGCLGQRILAGKLGFQFSHFAFHFSHRSLQPQDQVYQFFTCEGF